MTALTGRLPRWARYISSPAAATSVEISGSITMTPSSPSTRLMLDRSKPDLVDAGRDLVQALLGAELGLPPQARVGRVRAVASRKPKASMFHTTRPSAAFTPGLSESICPRSASSKSVLSWNGNDVWPTRPSPSTNAAASVRDDRANRVALG